MVTKKKVFKEIDDLHPSYVIVSRLHIVLLVIRIVETLVLARLSAPCAWVRFEVEAVEIIVCCGIWVFNFSFGSSVADPSCRVDIST